MVRHGTMPEVIYQRHLHISERVNESGVAEGPAIIFTTASRSERLDECSIVTDRVAGDADDEVTEYDSSFDGEETETDVSSSHKSIMFRTQVPFPLRHLLLASSTILAKSSCDKFFIINHPWHCCSLSFPPIMR